MNTTLIQGAHTSGDRAIGANIFTFMSMQARDHDPRDAVRLAESALAGAKNLTPAMEARIQASLANSAAHTGTPWLATCISTEQSCQ